MRVPITVLLFACTTFAFQAPKIDVEEKQAESHPHFGRFVELREHERLVLRCHGRFDDLIFKFPNLEGNMGYDAANFQDRVQEEIDEGLGDTVLTVNDVRESDTGTYSCVSEQHQSLNDTIHVFVHGSKIFLPLRSVLFVYNEGQVVVPCKTTQFVDKTDIELYANGELLKLASKYFDQRVGFKIIDKLYDMRPNENVKFECKHTKKPQQEVSYLVEEQERTEDVEADYQFYWDKGFDWPHVGYNYSQTCHLAHKGTKLFNTFYHKLRIECASCSDDHNSRVHVEKHRVVNNILSVKFQIEHLELEDSTNYKCIWDYENHPEKSIDFHLHVAPTRPQIKVLERSPQFLRVKEGRATTLSAKFAIYPTDEDHYVATWSRTYNSSIKEGIQSETIITGGMRTISSKNLGDGTFIETLNLGSEAMTTIMSGTYRLSIIHMNTSQSVQWEVAIENEKPDVQITVREPSTSHALDQEFHKPNTNIHINCISISIPPPTDVIFEQKSEETGEYEEIDQSQLMNVEGTYEKGFIWNVKLKEGAELRCSSQRQGKKYTATKHIAISDKAITLFSTIEKSKKAEDNELPKVTYEGDNVNLTCVLPTGDFDWEVFWRFKGNEMPSFDTYTANHSKHAVLRLEDVTAESSGSYSCVVKKNNNEDVTRIDVDVESISRPYHTDSDSRSAVTVEFEKPLSLYCNMTGNPYPVFQWFKNEEEYTGGYKNGSLLSIPNAHAMDDGQFECRASNRAGTTSKYIVVQVDNVPKESLLFYWILLLIILCAIVFLVIIFYLFYKLRVSKKVTKQKDIQLKELYDVLQTHNPGPLPEALKDLPIEERTNYIPYNKEYEIDESNLEFGTTLGSGNFGIVRKGQLRMADPKSEIEAKLQLTVAVKSSSRPYNVEAQKMMADELKIMNVIPKHPNVLCLIGAVTVNMRKGQFYIVTEYIDGGNLKDFLLKNRQSFVNKLVEEEVTVDDSYMVPNSVTKKKKYNFDGEEDHLLPGNNDALCTSDLLSIGLQIANGMEWLASIPCVHRDLACRNVLITRSKIIRIADFGLSKRHNDKNYYRIKSNAPTAIPVRWMSLEAFDSFKFNEKSDVWSFGITLYEIFSLGDLPYKNLATEHIMEYVRSGKRNPQPAYCHDDIFELMKNCWKDSPKERPKFSECIYYLKEHMKRCVPELLDRVDNMLHIEKEEQMKLEEYTKKSRSVTGRFQKKAPRKQQEEERYLIVESHA